MDENEIISNECLHIINGDYNENTKLTQEFNYLIKKPNSIFILFLSLSILTILLGCDIFI